MLLGTCPSMSRMSKFRHMIVITYIDFMVIVESCSNTTFRSDFKFSVTSSVVSTQQSSGISSTKLQVSKHKLVSNKPFKKILKERRRGMETCGTPVIVCNHQLSCVLFFGVNLIGNFSLVYEYHNQHHKHVV